MARKNSTAAKAEETKIETAPSGPEALPQSMRVRVVRPIRSRSGNYEPGQVVILPAATARSWIGFGLAEQDKSLSGAPETK